MLWWRINFFSSSSQRRISHQQVIEQRQQNESRIQVYFINVKVYEFVCLLHNHIPTATEPIWLKFGTYYLDYVQPAFKPGKIHSSELEREINDPLWISKKNKIHASGAVGKTWCHMKL